MLRHLLRVLAILPILLVFCLQCSPPAFAAAVDSYITRYLHLTEPIALDIDGKGETRTFSPENISNGKQLFENSCLNCHVGGATLPDPQVSLSLTKLQKANPPRDNINNLVAFFRQPMTYDGSQESFWCREVPESWMPQEQVENLAAFVLTAAQKALGWGTENF